MLFKKHTYYWVSVALFLISSCSNNNIKNAIPSSSNQLILVLTDSVKATKGSLYYFERESQNADWKILNNKIRVVLGRNGLGWGTGLQSFSNSLNFSTKEEGDGRSPAGIYTLSSVFGYESADKISNLKMPYIHISELVECIDDTTSKYYNQIVSRDKIEIDDSVDWNSSEKMKFAGIYYALGVVVDYNTDPINIGAGSCIFLHNWADPDETMAGCTAMEPVKMMEIVSWLDRVKNPIIVQLTRKFYEDLVKTEELPELIKSEDY